MRCWWGCNCPKMPGKKRCGKGTVKEFHSPERACYYIENMVVLYVDSYILADCIYRQPDEKYAYTGCMQRLRSFL